MMLIGPQIILLLACAYFGEAQRNVYDYLPPSGSGINGNILPPDTTTRRTTPSRTTPSRTTPSRTTPSRTTPSRTTPSRTTPPRVTPPRTRPPTNPPAEHHDDHHHHHHSDDPLQWLRDAVPGEPGDDYPIYWQIPETGFTCDGKRLGLYADPETRCQVFHTCTATASGTLDFISMLCPNGTIFNQEHFTCEWWNKVDCQAAEQFYSLNEQIGVVPEGSAYKNQRVRPDQNQVTRPRPPTPPRTQPTQTPRPIVTRPKPIATRPPPPPQTRRPPPQTRQPPPPQTRRPPPPIRQPLPPQTRRPPQTRQPSQTRLPQQTRPPPQTRRPTQTRQPSQTRLPQQTRPPPQTRRPTQTRQPTPSRPSPTPSRRRPTSRPNSNTIQDDGYKYSPPNLYDTPNYGRRV